MVQRVQLDRPFGKENEITIQGKIPDVD